MITGDVELFENGVQHNTESARPARGIHNMHKAVVDNMLRAGRTPAQVSASLNLAASPGDATTPLYSQLRARATELYRSLPKCDTVHQLQSLLAEWMVNTDEDWKRGPDDELKVWGVFMHSFTEIVDGVTLEKKEPGFLFTCRAIAGNARPLMEAWKEGMAFSIDGTFNLCRLVSVFHWRPKDTPLSFFFPQVLVEYGGHLVQADGAHKFVSIFLSLTATESADSVTKSIDIALEKILQFVGVELKAYCVIIDRAGAMKNGAKNSRIWMDPLNKRLLTCFEHLLYAGKVPGSKAVQSRIKDILRQAHKCASWGMVRAVVEGQTEEHRRDPEFTHALQWLDNLVSEWNFFITAGLPGSTPSQQKIESFNRSNKRLLDLNVCLNTMITDSIPLLLSHLSRASVHRVITTRSPVGMIHVVSCTFCSSVDSTSS